MVEHQEFVKKVLKDIIRQSSQSAHIINIKLNFLIINLNFKKSNRYKPNIITLKVIPKSTSRRSTIYRLI